MMVTESAKLLAIMLLVGHLFTQTQKEMKIQMIPFHHLLF